MGGRANRQRDRRVQGANKASKAAQCRRWQAQIQRFATELRNSVLWFERDMGIESSERKGFTLLSGPARRQRRL